MARLSARYAIAGLLGVAFAFACAGCPNGNPLGLGPTLCDRSLAGNPAVLYRDGIKADGWYQTTDWYGENQSTLDGGGRPGWLLWKGGQHYALEHDLGCVPTMITGYLSFSEQGLGGDQAGFPSAADAAPVSNASIASGDDFAILEVTDHQLIVANQTCSEFFLRVVAGGCTPPPTLGAALSPPDAGDDG